MAMPIAVRAVASPTSATRDLPSRPPRGLILDRPGNLGGPKHAVVDLPPAPGRCAFAQPPGRGRLRRSNLMSTYLPKDVSTVLADVVRIMRNHHDEPCTSRDAQGTPCATCAVIERARQLAAMPSSAPDAALFAALEA